MCVVRCEGWMVENHLKGIALVLFSIETNQQQLYDFHSRVERRIGVAVTSFNDHHNSTQCLNMSSREWIMMPLKLLNRAKNAATRHRRHLCSVPNVKYDAMVHVFGVCTYKHATSGAAKRKSLSSVTIQNHYSFSFRRTIGSNALFIKFQSPTNRTTHRLNKTNSKLCDRWVCFGPAWIFAFAALSLLVVHVSANVLNDVSTPKRKKKLM